MKAQRTGRGPRELCRGRRSGSTGSRALWCVAIALLPATFLLLSILPAAWAQNPSNEAGTAAGGGEAAGNLIGVYITALRDFDTVDDSFGADFWIWSVHPRGDNPLDSTEFVNAEQLETRLKETTSRNDQEWSRLKARATVLHDWDVSNFPFDRQTLTIDLGIVDPGARAYGVDRAGSGYGANVAPNGWRVTGFTVERRTVASDTDFGDPLSSGNSSQEHLFVSVALERDSVVGFFKLVAGVYAAIAIALLTFLMTPDQPPIFAGRTTVLVGALFATVVNLQVGDNVLGSLEGLSMVAKIHIIALAYVFAATLMTLLSRKTCEAGQKDRARRRDLISLCVFGISFLVINVVLILQAAASG